MCQQKTEKRDRQDKDQNLDAVKNNTGKQDQQKSSRNYTCGSSMGCETKTLF